jgi:hypothetical protein
VGGGVAAEEDAVLAVADGLLDEAELGAVQPAAEQVDEEHGQGGGDVEGARSGGIGEVVAEDELEVGEAVVAAEQEVVAEKHDRAA